MSDTEPPSELGTRGPTIVLIVVFAFLDLLTAAILSEAGEVVLPARFAGGMAGQLGLLSVWGVVGPQPPIVRFPVTLATAVLLWCIFALGATMTDAPEQAILEIARCVLLLPLVFLAAQLPVWALRGATGCRIVRRGTPSVSRAAVGQFGLQQMLGVTTAVAVAFALAWLGLPDNRLGRDLSTTRLWLPLLFSCSLVAVWSLFATLPCIWAAFVPRNAATGVGAVAVYTIAMTLVVQTVVHVIVGRPMDDEFVAGLFFFHGSLLTVLLGGLLIARATDRQFDFL